MLAARSTLTRAAAMHWRRAASAPVRRFTTELAMLAPFAPAIVTAAAAAWMVFNYHISKPNQYLIRTGLGIRDVKVSKSGFRMPLQSAMIVKVNPTTYSFRLHNMSKGMVEFELPVVMTIGPKLPETDHAAFLRYCKLLQDMPPDEIASTVKGIIEGETRGLTAQLSVEEMFNGKEIFREKVVSKLQEDLGALGLTIYNANIQEMKDYDANNKYFEYRKQRAIEMANNDARAEVAEARKQGDVAVSMRDRDTRIAKSQNERDAKVAEYARQQEELVAFAELSKQQAQTQQVQQVEMMKAVQGVKLEEQRLQRDIEQRRYEQSQLAMRADIVAPAEAEAQAKILAADAAYYAKEREAAALQKVMEAKAQGMRELLNSCGSSPELAKFYLGVDSGLWKEVALQSANAVRDMKPTITQWQTGPAGSSSGLPIVELVQNMVPLYQEVMKQVKKDQSPASQ